MHMNSKYVNKKNKAISTNVHKGTATHQKHSEASADNLYSCLAYQWFYCGLDTSACTDCKIKATLVSSKDRLFHQSQGWK